MREHRPEPLPQVPLGEYRERGSDFRERFWEAMAVALPDLPEAELKTRLHFVHGAIQHVWAHCPLPADETPERLQARFVAFFAAGLQAPAVEPTEPS